MYWKEWVACLTMFLWSVVATYGLVSYQQKYHNEQVQRVKAESNYALLSRDYSELNSYFQVCSEYLREAIDGQE